MYRAVSYLMRYHSEVIPQEYVYVMKTEGPRTEPFSTPYNDDTIKMHNPIFFPSTIWSTVAGRSRGTNNTGLPLSSYYFLLETKLLVPWSPL